MVTESYERIRSVYVLKCPLCGKKMSSMREGAIEFSAGATDTRELIYFCEQHGTMNKMTDLKDKADQVAKKA